MGAILVVAMCGSKTLLLDMEASKMIKSETMTMTMVMMMMPMMQSNTNLSVVLDHFEFVPAVLRFDVIAREELTHLLPSALSMMMIMVVVVI